MNVRRATSADASQVLKFLRQFRAEGLDTVLQHDSLLTIQEEEAFISKLDGQSGIMLVAEAGGRVVGSLTAEIHRHPQLQHSCEFGMGVLSEHRATGTGSKLIGQLTEWALSKHLRRIELSVLGNNPRAIALYCKLGFVEEGRKRGAIRVGTRYEDSVQMVLEL
jgi:RimJ/RimL family protein N-acetyltransferase